MRAAISVLIILFGCAGFGLGVCYWEITDNQQQVIQDANEQLSENALSCQQSNEDATQDRIINALAALQAQTDKLQRKLVWMQTHGVVVRLVGNPAEAKP